MINHRRLNMMAFAPATALLLGLLALLATLWAAGGTHAAVSDAIGAMWPRPLVEGWHAFIPYGGLVAVALNVAVAVGLLIVTRRYNLSRGITALPAGLFLLLQASMPGLMLDAWMALLPAVVTGCSMLLFSRYDRPGTNRMLCLIFVILSATALLSWAVVWYIPLFVFGMAQMRDMTPKSVTALVIGLGIPLWLAWAVWPSFFHHWQWPAPTALPQASIYVLCAVWAVVTAAVALAAYGIGLARIITYKPNIRSMHGFFTVMLLVTILAMCVDYTHIMVYAPMLNICAAFETAHALACQRLRAAWTAVPALALIYAFFYLWQTAI